MAQRSAVLFIIIFLAGVVAGCVLLDRPPAALPASAPADQFSAERAWVYLNAFAQKPHPVGTPEHDHVRDYLIDQLKNLGFAPEIQRGVGVTPIYQAAGNVENIAVRLKGSSGASDAVMLAAHYDSVAAAPGAADDGSGVAALLETLRALRLGPPLKNDLIVLLTDGEEEGMLGASAFVAENPWAKDVRVAVNFEARGNAGPAELFETSAGNERLVKLFANVAPHPAGSSLTYEFYKRMPNDTDLTVFKKSGEAGLNFAFDRHWEAYHTPRDNPRELDRGSLQQQGEYALSLARALGNADLKEQRVPDAVFFALPGGPFIRYSVVSTWPLTIFAGLVVIALCFLAVRERQAGLAGLLAALIAHAALLVATMMVAFGFAWSVQWLHLHLLREGNVVQSPTYTISLISLLIAFSLVGYRFLRTRMSPGALALAGAVILLVFAALMAKRLASGAYIMLWPLLVMVLAIATLKDASGRPLLYSAVALCITAAAPLLLFVPLLRGLYTGLGLTTLGAPIMALVVFVLLLSMLPLVELLSTLTPSLLPVAGFSAALILFGVGATTTHYSAAHPKPSVVLYALDADTGKAVWASSATRADSWSAQYVGTSPSKGRLPGFYPAWLPFEFLQHEAPALPLVPPEAELIESTGDADSRTIRVRVRSPRGGRALFVDLPGSEVVDAYAEGHKLGLPADSRWNKLGSWSVNYANLPADGVELRLRIKGSGKVKVVVVDSSIGLPPVPGETFAPRPANSVPRHSGDQTLALRSFEF